MGIARGFVVGLASSLALFLAVQPGGAAAVGPPEELKLLLDGSPVPIRL
jgi:hypothetical protein